MPRQARNVETRIGGRCKVRKRGGSSSSSSSILQNYRFKRAILVGKKGGSSTPVPTWKIRSKSSSQRIADCDATSQDGIKARQSSISARKLAATLWEINGIPLKENSEEKKKKSETKNRERTSNSKSLPLPLHLSDPWHSPISEGLHQGRGVISHRRKASDISLKLQLTNYTFGGLGSFGDTSLMEIENHSRGHTPRRDTMGTKTRLKDVGKSLAASKELINALNHIWGMEEQNSSSMTLVAALRTEIDHARIQVEQLIHDQRSSRHKINCLMKHFAEEKAAWKRKERDRIQGAIESIARELEIEKKLRRQTERLNKKPGKELADTKASMLKAVKELESERRTTEILEQVCDELARGIGEDRAEFEELKRESAKVREVVEKEREMLQLADIFREERVQMKLSEAKYQFEEKNAAVEKLRKELKSYLGNKIKRENGDEDTPNSGSVGYGAYMMKNYPGLCLNGEIEYNDDDDGEVADGEEQEGEDSADCDLHSIELNMDNINKSYKSIYSCRDGDPSQEDSKRNSVEEMFKGRKSISEKVQGGSISLTKGNSNNVQLESTTKTQGNTDTFDLKTIIKTDSILCLSSSSHQTLSPLKMETGAIKNDGIFLGCLKRRVGKVIETACTAKKLGKDDPRRVVHSLKVGAALTLASLLYYLDPLYDGFGMPGIWALMTVVVVFEFSVGATIGKGLNRGLATLLAGALGVGVHYVASLFGNIGEPIVIGSFVFLQAAISTFIRFFPGIKARYDYGFLIFILTFSMVSLSSVRDDNIIEFAKKRLLTILIGGFTCVMICTCICPVWAGEDLHNLVALNIEKLGNFLEGFGNEYFRLSEDEECNSEKSVLQAYKSVLTSKNTEEALANFARWEPGHGKFRFRHPWNQYLSIGSATRECAYRIEALTGCLNSEIQVDIKSKMQETCMEVSSECSKALKELASAVKKMTTPFSAEPHIEDSKDAANRLKSLMNSEVWKGRDLLDVIPAATVASLLIDVVICTEKISSSVHDLASLAHFKSAKTKVSGSEKTEGSDLKIIGLPPCEDYSSVVITVRE